MAKLARGFGITILEFIAGFLYVWAATSGSFTNAGGNVLPGSAGALAANYGALGGALWAVGFISGLTLFVTTIAAFVTMTWDSDIVATLKMSNMWAGIGLAALTVGSAQFLSVLAAYILGWLGLWFATHK